MREVGTNLSRSGEWFDCMRNYAKYTIHCATSLTDVIWRWHVEKKLPKKLTMTVIHSDNTTNICDEAKTESKHSNWQTELFPRSVTTATHAPITTTEIKSLAANKTISTSNTSTTNIKYNDNKSPSSPFIYKNIWAKTQGALRSLGKFCIKSTAGYRVDANGLTSMDTDGKYVC